MLRASIESEGGEADLRGLVDGAAAKDTGIPGAEALVAFVEATLARGVGGPSGAGSTAEAADAAVAEARARVASELGEAAMIDAAAVIGNFERMVRIADGIGIPLDAPVQVATEAVRAELGLDDFGSAARTPAVRGWQRVLGRVLDPVVRAILRRRARRTVTRGSIR